MSVTPPDTVRVQTAENVSLGYATAGLGSRLVAQMIDNLIAFALVLVALIGYGALAGAASTEQGAAWAVGGAVAFTTFVYLGYFLVSELVSTGRTPGKAAMGLRVMRVDGRAADFASIAVRDIVRIVDLTGVGIVVMFFQPLSRRLGDLAAGTVVVRDRAAHSLASVAAPAPVLTRTPDAGPRVEGVERLGPREQDALRVFLSRPGLTPELRARLAAELSSRLLDRLQLPAQAPERLWPPELFIERLYLQLQNRST